MHELELIKECFLMYLKMLGKHPILQDLPNEWDVREFDLNQIVTTLHMTYSISLVTLPIFPEGAMRDAKHPSIPNTVIDEITIITALYNQLIYLIKDYKTNIIKEITSKLAQTELELVMLRQENNVLSKKQVTKYVTILE